MTWATRTGRLRPGRRWRRRPASSWDMQPGVAGAVMPAAGGGRDALGVGQVAGVLVGDCLLDPARWRLEGQVYQELVDVLDYGGEAAGLLGVGGVAGQQFAVLLHGGAAAGG